MLVDETTIEIFADSDAGWIPLTETALNVGSEKPQVTAKNKKVQQAHSNVKRQLFLCVRVTIVLH